MIPNKFRRAVHPLSTKIYQTLWIFRRLITLARFTFLTLSGLNIPYPLYFGPTAVEARTYQIYLVTKCRTVFSVPHFSCYWVEIKTKNIFYTISIVGIKNWSTVPHSNTDRFTVLSSYKYTCSPVRLCAIDIILSFCFTTVATYKCAADVT